MWWTNIGLHLVDDKARAGRVLVTSVSWRPNRRNRKRWYVQRRIVASRRTLWPVRLVHNQLAVSRYRNEWVSFNVTGMRRWQVQNWFQNDWFQKSFLHDANNAFLCAAGTELNKSCTWFFANVYQCNFGAHTNLRIFWRPSALSMWHKSGSANCGAFWIASPKINHLVFCSSNI